MAAPWLDGALAALAGIRETAAEHGCPDLTDAAIENARAVVRALAGHPDLPEPHVVPGVDPGVGITFRRIRRRWFRRRVDRILFVEVDNDGTVVFCVYDGRGWPRAAEAGLEGLADAAAASARFLLEGEPVPWE